jgi:hypothetical protein
MSYYNSENTEILAMHTEEGFHPNTRMLLLHKTNCEHRPHEYVIGSYFTAKWNPLVEVFNYSWDWGHYFGSVVDAVDYWKREVLGEES